MLMAMPLKGSCEGNLFCFLQLLIKTGTARLARPSERF